MKSRYRLMVALLLVLIWVQPTMASDKAANASETSTEQQSDSANGKRDKSEDAKPDNGITRCGFIRRRFKCTRHPHAGY